MIAFSRRYQSTLGQLPFEAFRRSAAEGQVLAAWDGPDLVAYTLYRVRKRTGVVVLVHLCVDERHRGRGHAERMVDLVCERNSYAPGLAAWCREDFPAHRRWPSLGFDRTSTRPGRGRQGKRLVHWWRPINELTLFTFSAADEAVPAAAIDTNVFRDIVEPRVQFSESLALDEPWLLDGIELVITGQLATEIEEASQTVGALKHATARFRWLSPSPDKWRPVLAQLSEAIATSSIGPGDRRQLAQACAGDARFFVTRDGAVLSNRDAIESVTGVQVVTPLDLTLAMHADQFEMNYEAAALRESDLDIRHPRAFPPTADLVRFTDHTRNEKSSDLKQELRAVAPRIPSGGRLWEIAASDDEPIAIAATSIDRSTLVAHCIRVRRDKHSVTFARQLLHLLREEAVNNRLDMVRFEGSVPDYLNTALIDEGYIVADDCWLARCSPGHIGPPDLVPGTSPAARASELQPEQISHLERVLWPMKIIGGSVPTYIVPIQPVWARALFGDEPYQAELFPRPARLSLAREHVYFRSLTRRIDTPARLLWWVSGGGGNSGMRACSWLEATVAGRPRTLYRRFGSQGIYQLPNVEALVKREGGEALALIFSRTETFRNRVPLALARSVFPPIARNGYLQTTREVSEHVFAHFYEIGTTQ